MPVRRCTLVLAWLFPASLLLPLLLLLFLLLLLLPAGSARAQAPDSGQVVQVGQVAVVEGSDETVDSTGPQPVVKLGAISRKVIEKFGDHFQAITLWATFDESSNPNAAAYELTVRHDVRGLGISPRDSSAGFGSQGVLRSILNMKQVHRNVTEDTPVAWRSLLEIWGQESGHRWMVQMLFRDRRSGRNSDALLGRDCTHYSRFVDTQGSVQDGFEWTDNKNGTFTIGQRAGYRFGNLDLYGMGLMAADELPPFFFIDDIPGYTRPPCGSYQSSPRPLAPTIPGTRVDVEAADIVAANGPRVPAAYERLNGQPQDYFREAQVIITRPGEKATDGRAQQLASRIDKVRLFWEAWIQVATDRRMVVCTQINGDCGDARSDVRALDWKADRRSPAAGPLALEVQLTNPGDWPSTKVEATLTTEIAGVLKSVSKSVGTLAPRANQTVSFEVDARTVPCGTPIVVKAITQSDFHRHRLRRTLLVGAESMASEGFEADSGWKVNPDGNDSSKGAIWERGTPEWTEIVNGKPVQPGVAHEGQGAFVTGLAAAGGARDPFVYGGRTTLESPVFDGSAWREPRLRYWVSFAGVKAEQTTGEVVPSSESRLLVLARALPGGGADGGAGDAGAPANEWVEVDWLEGLVTEQWDERVALLPASFSGARFQVRFVTEDANPMRGGVEAAIDDVEVFSNLPACYQPVPASGAADGRKGGGCSVPPTAPATPSAPTTLFLLAAAALLARPRRQGPRERGGRPSQVPSPARCARGRDRERVRAPS